MVDISDVICAFSEWEDLEAAIGSVNRQTRHAREIIVLMDHNEQLLAQVRSASAWPDVLRTIEGNRGAPGGGGRWSSGGSCAREPRPRTGVVPAASDDC
jgi:glucosyl-dolichyl phosphate glucuronosyltransferase